MAQTGTFIVSYESADQPLGARSLRLDLIVDMVHAIASGTAEVTQAVNPPLNVKLPVQGPVITMTVMPNITHYQLKLSSPQMPGRHIDVTAVVESDWQTGKAHVVLWLDTPSGLIDFATNIKTATALQSRAS
jgi:hypothetical protein